MTRKLDEADRAAVDMLFDRINAASNGNGGNSSDRYVAMTGAVSEGRIQAVEKVLQLLSQMPAPEPSPDLAVRTLNRIARSAGQPNMPPIPGTYVDPGQPMA